MIPPPTSQISHHDKITNITMLPTSLSPIEVVRNLPGRSQLPLILAWSGHRWLKNFELKIKTVADKTWSLPVILVSWRNSWLKTFPILNSENSMYLDKLPGRKNSKFRHGWSCLYSISPSILTRTIFSLLQSIDFSSLDVTVVDSKTTVWFSDLTFGAHEMYWFCPIIWSKDNVWLHWCWWRMSETKCVGDNFELMTVSAVFDTNMMLATIHQDDVGNIYLWTLASGTNIQKRSSISKFCH